MKVEQMIQAMLVDVVNDEVLLEKRNITKEQLGKGNTLIQVEYTSLNYKDMLATQTNGGVIRQYPMIPGIDLAGEIVATTSDRFQVGDKVVVTGYELGVTHPGGFCEYACVPDEWVIKLPNPLSTKEAMLLGTAGITAALSVRALEKAGMSVKNQPSILVTGASGGVGSIALALLKKQGYTNVTALIRKDYQKDIVKKLGASQIIYPDAIFLKEKPTLLKGVYDFVLDTVGGKVATHLIPQINYGGAISLCGNAGGIDLSTNVLPFILRGISAIGIDSVQIDHNTRECIWQKFATDWYMLDNLHMNEITCDQIEETLNQLKQGMHLGRSIVRVANIQ